MINIGQGVVVGLALVGTGDALALAVGGIDDTALQFIPYLSATGMLILLSAAAFIASIVRLPGPLHFLSSSGQTVAAFAVALVPWYCECGTQRLNNTEEKQQDNHHQRDS